MESHAEDERAGTAGSPLLRLRGVGREFDGGAVVALRSVDFVVRPGENIGIVGPSGSGKSSLVQIMGGCDIPTRGAVFWRGRSMERLSDWAGIRGVEVSIVFQDYLLLPTSDGDGERRTDADRCGRRRRGAATARG